jgi:uncharacterized protein
VCVPGPVIAVQTEVGVRPPLTLDVLAEPLSVLRLAADADVPAWALRAGTFGNVTRTAHELSVVCTTARVPSASLPADTAREDGWRALEVVGPFAFTEVGVLLQVAASLADARISILAMATFDTDYVLVQETQLAPAIAALRRAGHTVRSESSLPSV